MTINFAKYGVALGKLNEDVGFRKPTNSGGVGDPVGQIRNAAKGGWEQMGQAIQESQAGINPLETGAKFGAGAINTVFSPLAPVFQPVGEGINAIANKVADIPQVQKFAMGKGGEIASRGAELTQNLSTIAGTAAGVAQGQIAKANLTKQRLNNPPPPPGPDSGNYAPQLSKVAEEWRRPANEPSASFRKTKIALETNPKTPEFLAKQRLNPHTHLEDGKYMTEGSAEALKNTAGKMSHETLRPSLQMADYNTPPTPITEVLKSGNLKVSKNISLTAGDIQAVKGMVAKEIQALSKKYPKGMSLADMHDEGITYNQNGGYKPFASASDANKATANRAIGSAMKTMVETKAPPEVPVHDFNQYLKQYYQAADYLDSLHGKVAPITKTQAAARMVAKFGGAALARHLVPGMGELITSFAGYQLGKALEHALENMTNPMRDTFLKNLKITNPEAFNKVAGFIGNEKVAQITRPRLPAGSYIPMGSGEKPQVPAGGVKLLPAPKGPTGFDVKSGKFKTTYKSQ